MNKVGIEWNGIKGNIEFDPDNLENFEVEFSDRQKKAEIEAYLTTKRKYNIPTSGRMDDYRVDEAYPTDGLTYFELALSTLLANTRVWVHW